MACLDIYQALRERRPYKEPMSHEKTLEILRDMSANGFIDGKIVEDIDKVLKDAA
jgi:HD-GYP domain-containing protein (c-di-GMP phosphodiesterase class II)